MSRLLWRASRRYLLRHPWQLLLAVVGIALGVAVVLAVDLANASARRSFALSMDQVAGRATHRIGAGPGGVAENVYVRLRRELGLRDAAPVVTGHVVPVAEPGRQLQVLGIDLFAEGPFRAHAQGPAADPAGLVALLTRPDAALLPAGPQQRDTLEVLAGGRRTVLQRAGTLPAASQGLIVMDIAAAQVLLDKLGRLDHIDLILPQGAAGEALAKKIGAWLPPGLRLERTAERTRAVGELSGAFELNLTALSLLALVVGMFLIYNTMSFAVVQRRALLGMLRALGVSRREVFILILGEALLLGLAGTVLGGLAGVWLGSVLVELVTRTIDDLYHALTVRE
nr:FtsX-like permease family protein [Pseudomonadota bacterium]